MWIVNARLPRYIGKRTVTVVVIQHVVTCVGDVKVEKAIVIVVADGDTHTVADVPHSGLFSDVDEAQLAGLRKQVLVEPVAGLPAGWGRGYEFARVETRALDEIDVQIAVVVVIKQGHAGAHDLGHIVMAGCEIEMTKVETGLGRDVPENRPFVCPGSGERDSTRGEHFQKIATMEERFFSLAYALHYRPPPSAFRSRSMLVSSWDWPCAIAASRAFWNHASACARSPARAYVAASA